MPFTNRSPDAEYKGHKIWIDLDHEDDCIKAYHFVQLPNGLEISPDISPYDRSVATVKLWIDAGYPQNQQNWTYETLQQLLEKRKMSVWQEQDGDFSAEYSDLKVNKCLKNGKVTIHGGRKVDLDRFDLLYDQYGDILCWSVIIDGTTYTVSNDTVFND